MDNQKSSQKGCSSIEVTSYITSGQQNWTWQETGYLNIALEDQDYLEELKMSGVRGPIFESSCFN